MSRWRRFKFWLLGTSDREKVEWAYGLWLASPRSVHSATFISNITGIPREEVRGILLGKRER